MSKKDKGKCIQKAEDYPFVPTKNTFQPIVNFPLLPTNMP